MLRLPERKKVSGSLSAVVHKKITDSLSPEATLLPFCVHCGNDDDARLASSE